MCKITCGLLRQMDQQAAIFEIATLIPHNIPKPAIHGMHDRNRGQNKSGGCNADTTQQYPGADKTPGGHR